MALPLVPQGEEGVFEGVRGRIEDRVEGGIEDRVEGGIEGRVEDGIDGRIEDRVEDRIEGRGEESGFSGGVEADGKPRSTSGELVLA